MKQLQNKQSNGWATKVCISCFSFIAILGLGFLTIAGCSVGEFGGSTSKPSRGGFSGKLILTGSSTIAPLAHEIGKRFEEAHPSVRIDVQTGGSSRGIRDAIKGAADIGMSSRYLNTDESAELDTTVIARDGVAFVVHRDNPIKQISPTQLRQIYSGKIQNWSELGQPKNRIVVSNRAAGRSELSLICDYLEIEPGDIQADMVDGETQQSLKSVINNSKAITYTSVGAAQDAVARGEPLKLLPLDGVDASSETVRSGQFPLARPLILAVNTKSLGLQKADLVNAFLEFAKSEEVADAAVKLGFVPTGDSAALSETE